MGLLSEPLFILLAITPSAFHTYDVPNMACDGWREYKYEDCTCLKFVIKPQLYWQDARSRCQEIDADLVTIDNEAKQEYVGDKLDSISDRRGVWIGIERLASTHKHTWVDGKVVEDGYTNWGRDEPNNFLNSQDCVLMHRDDRWGWRDFQCTAVEQYSYICQYEIPCGLKEESGLPTTAIIGIVVGGVAGLIIFFAAIFLLINCCRSMVSRRKRGDRPHIALQPVEMGYVDDNQWNEEIEDERGVVIPPPENRRGMTSSGNNLDQSFKKKTRAPPAAGCRAPSKAAEATGAAGAAGISGLNQQRNITRHDTTDPDLPPTYSEAVRRLSTSSIEDNVLEANKDTDDNKHYKTADVHKQHN